MSDAQLVREAAQRVIMYLSDSPDSGATVGDIHDVCRAWLAEHPADDDIAVTVEWLQSVGLINQWYDDAWGTNQYGEEIGIAICVPSGGVMLATNGYITAPKDLVCPTRGDVRRLARALRVELGEKR